MCTAKFWAVLCLLTRLWLAAADIQNQLLPDMKSNVIDREAAAESRIPLEDLEKLLSTEIVWDGRYIPEIVGAFIKEELKNSSPTSYLYDDISQNEYYWNIY